MSKTKLIVYMEKTIFEVIKKKAISKGKSKSEIAADLIGSALENDSGSTEGGEPGIDPVEAIKKAIRDLRKERKDEESETLAMIADLELETLEPKPEGGPGLSPEIVRYLVETQARIDYLITKITGLTGKDTGATDGEIADWKKMAERTGKEILKNLKMGGEE